MASEVNKNGVVEVSPWLKGLAIAPEYHPTLAEFEDPIAYIFKIEKEASRYGICKIIPPLASATRKTVVSNLNKSLSARPGSNGPTFTTRQQQIGFCPRKHNRPVQKPVWQSGDSYTVQDFESKAKGFEKNYLKRYITKRSLNSLEIESLFWKASLDKPFSVEYANDMPGSAFSVRKENVNGTVGDSDWNMRGVSRAKGSLLRFMKEEIPGVTSPMVYIAMMFSWFAWHVEDHDLHSLNYLHTGASKTWYGVPKDAAMAFEDVIRGYGYGGEINPLVTFATLGEKTTVMSPEVLINAGIPCCRLVQNPGEFVVTFPRAYHTGFSHGFNIGEASNIATPEWLIVAKDAAIRRASINAPPMVSHFQLLYDLALSLYSRVPKNICMEPRSSRLREKKKDEGEILVKDMFLQDVLKNNDLLHSLGKKSSIVILPRISNLQNGPQSKVKARLFTGLCSPDLEVKTRKNLLFEHLSGSEQVKNVGNDKCDRVTNQGLFSCITCGILCFASVAIIKPNEVASQYLMSSDCSIFNDWEETIDGLTALSEAASSPIFQDQSCNKGKMLKRNPEGLFDVPVKLGGEMQLLGDEKEVVVSCTEAKIDTSSLGLLALNYGDSSDSDEDECKNQEVNLPDSENIGSDHGLDVIPLKIDDSYAEYGLTKARIYGKNYDSTPEKSLDHFALSNTVHKAESSTKSDDDSSRIHIFCLEHAVQVEQQLRAIGGAHIVLLCHPDYPELEAQAKKVAEELGQDHIWNNISFRQSNKHDEETIQLALNNEESIHGNSDWSVKLGINLYYSANLSKSPLYTKQMPYNRVIYNTFGCYINETFEKSSSRQKKIVFSGKWCGKVWMSNQVHPLLAHEDRERNISSPSPVKLGQTSLATYRVGGKRKVSGSIVKAEESEEDFGVLVKACEQFHKTNLRSKRMKSVKNMKKLTSDSEDEDFKSRKNRFKSKKMKKESVNKKVDSDSENERKKVKNEPHMKRLRNINNLESDNILSEVEDTRNKRMKPETPEPESKSVRKVNHSDDEFEGGPSTRLRKRSVRKVEVEVEVEVEKTKKTVPRTKIPDLEFECEIEGCTMSFSTKQELITHKKNICPVKGCGKKFFSHKYLVQHQRVHMDDRPLKCPWQGCNMSFKWAWARTEHVRVHTGARPYICAEPGCGTTFRFVSDFSRHKRKTGHAGKKVIKKGKKVKKS